MDFLNFVLPVLLYVFGIILIIVLIVLGIRLIQVINKIDLVVDDFSKKLSSFDGFIRVIDKTTGGITFFVDKVLNNLISLTSKIFNKRKKEKEDYYE